MLQTTLDELWELILSCQWLGILLPVQLVCVKPASQLVTKLAPCKGGKQLGMRQLPSMLQGAGAHQNACLSHMHGASFVTSWMSQSEKSREDDWGSYISKQTGGWWTGLGMDEVLPFFFFHSNTPSSEKQAVSCVAWQTAVHLPLS